MIILYIYMFGLWRKLNVKCTDCIGSGKSNYHMITTRTDPKMFFEIVFYNLIQDDTYNSSRLDNPVSVVVGFTTTYAISAYHYWCCEFESRSGRGVQHYVIKFVTKCWLTGKSVFQNLTKKTLLPLCRCQCIISNRLQSINI
jgi:hypothetical protein